RHCLAVLRDLAVYLIDHSTVDCCKVRRAKRFSHTCEREIEMLSFGAIDAIVEHIVELTGAVATSFDLLPVADAGFKLTKHTPTNSAATADDDDETDYLGTLI